MHSSGMKLSYKKQAILFYLGDKRTACSGFCLFICFLLDSSSQKHLEQNDESIEELIYLNMNT